MIEICNPVTYLKTERTVRAPLILKGKRVALFNNSKPNVDVLYGYLARWLPSRFETGPIVNLMKANAARPAPQDVLNKLIEQADVIINAIGD